MGWVLGFFGEDASLVRSFGNIHPEALYKIEKKRIYLAVGGIKETCHFGLLSPEGGWVVVGLGIKRNTDNIQILSTTDWQSIIAKEKPDLEKLDGHFLVIRYQPKKIEFFTDPLGLRTVFLAEGDNGIFFSTRLDWLAKLTERKEIDFESFGAHWFLSNQISYDCLLRRIKRLGPNGFAIWKQNSLSLKGSPWTPRCISSELEERHLEIDLRAFLKPKIEGLTISLGLSGGLDSRVLLSLLLSEPKSDFSLYLFSHPLDPDVMVAKKIAQENNLFLFHFYEPLPNADEILKILSEYIGQTCAVESAAKLLILRYYSQIHSQRKFSVDGGFGEIWRRQYLNRLLIRGRKILRSGNLILISYYLRRKKAEIFNQDVKRIMEKGIERQIRSLWEVMPKWEEISLENFLDLWAIRTYLPNIGAYEQARLDCEVLNYMPFAQPSFLQNLFQISLAKRRNSRLFKKIIKKNCPNLAKYPLVKNQTTYPFFFSPTMAWVWTKIKSRLGFCFSNPLLFELFNTLRDFIQDTIRSPEVKSYAPYDYPKIVRLVEEFYAGRKELAEQIDWWLTFELWRRVLSG